MYVLLNGKLVNSAMVAEFSRVEIGMAWIIRAQNGPGNSTDYDFETEALRDKRWTELDLELR